MPRHPIPFAVPDMSALAKSLRAQLASRPTPPTHVEMLNMLARAAGHRNFQHVRARREDRPTDDRASPADPVSGAVPAQPDSAAVLRAARYFDPQGRLRTWPAHRSVQDLCLWALWSRIPSRRAFDERQISAAIAPLHLFGDPAIIRRTMCHIGLMTRRVDGREYRRVERPPSPDGAALIRHVHRGGH